MNGFTNVDVLVVGGGFGGWAAAHRLERRLRHRPERVLLVAPDNFLTFTPLLPEAASGTLEPRHTVMALRQLLPRTEVLAGRVTSLDLERRQAEVADLNGSGHRVAFRTVVLAPGAVPTVLPIPGLADHAVGFKSLADAIWLRNHVLRQLEAAEAATDREERRRLLTFTFVGGGYAGVEALAELESLVRDALAAYPQLHARDLRWVLVEIAGTLLPGLDERLAAYSLRQLRRRGIEVHLRTRLVSCEDGVVRLAGAGAEAAAAGATGADGDGHLAVPPYASGTLVWTAGQRPDSLAAEAGLAVDERGRVPVDDHLRVPGCVGVYVVGDAAAVPDPDGGLCPPTAQHALRQGHTAAANVAADLGAGDPAPFRYRTRGLAVTLGRHRGVAQVKGRVFTGPLAWWMGRSYHLLMVPGLSRRLRVVSDWTLALAFPRDVSQLGALGEPSPLAAPARR